MEVNGEKIQAVGTAQCVLRIGAMTFFTEMTEYHQKSYSLGGDEGLNGGDPEEQTFTNLNCKHLHLNVTIQVGDQNQVNILANKSDLTPASSCSDQSFSSDSVDEPDYMDMSNAPDTPPSWSLSSGSCGNNQAFYEAYSSTDRRYNDAFWSSDDLNNSDITLSKHGTSSSRSGFSGFSELPDLQTDGLPSKSDTIPDNQQPKRLSLTIPEKFLCEAAQTVQGYRKDVDVGKLDISGALRQA